MLLPSLRAQQARGNPKIRDWMATLAILARHDDTFRYLAWIRHSREDGGDALYRIAKGD